MTDDATFERDLRTMLAARDPGPAPASLGIGIQRRVAASSSRAPGIFRLGAGLASAVAAAAVVVLAFVLLTRPTGVGTPPSPTPLPSAPALVGPDAVAVGAGIAEPAGAPIIQVALVAAAVIALVAIAVRTARKRTAVIATLLIVAIAGATIAFAAAAPLGRRSGGFGVGPVEETPDRTALVVAGGGTFWVEITLTNVSPLPLTIRGLDRSSVPPVTLGPAQPGFVGMGLLDQQFGPEGALPFHPVTLAAGGSVDVVLRGSPGDCALTSLDASNGVSAGFVSVPLQIEQLTVVRTASMPLDRPLLVPIRGNCPSD